MCTFCSFSVGDEDTFFLIAKKGMHPYWVKFIKGSSRHSSPSRRERKGVQGDTLFFEKKSIHADISDPLVRSVP
jgi:hypothetical protein